MLLFGVDTGFTIYLLPLSEFNQFSVLLHTLVGQLSLPPVIFFVVRHWWLRKQGKLSYYQ